MPANLQALRSRLQRKYRKLTAGRRCLADFVVFGAQKAGTSSLFTYLERHPQVHMACQKEVHYFDRHLDWGEKWYRSHFPLRSAVGPDERVGEATPCYLLFPHAAEQLSRLHPGTRIIVLLRNPVERAISHYFHNRRKKKEVLEPLAAFQAEEGRIRQAYAGLLRDPLAKSWEVANYGYKARGAYDRQLRRLLRAFPRSQILLLSAERLAENPREVLDEVFQFIGVDPTLGSADEVRANVGSNREDLPPEVHAYLTEWFRPHHRRFLRRFGPVYPFPED